MLPHNVCVQLYDSLFNGSVNNKMKWVLFSVLFCFYLCKAENIPGVVQLNTGTFDKVMLLCCIVTGQLPKPLDVFAKLNDKWVSVTVYDCTVCFRNY